MVMPANNSLGPFSDRNFVVPISSSQTLNPTTSNKALTGRPRSTLAPRSTTGSTARNSTGSLAANRSTSPTPSSLNHPTLRTHSSTASTSNDNGNRSVYAGSIAGVSVAGSSKNGSMNPVHSLQHSQNNLMNASKAKTEDIDKFVSLCMDLYYRKDPGAAQAVDSTLKKLPVAFRTTYAKAMAGVRRDYHLFESKRRLEEVNKLLIESLPSSTIMSALNIPEGGVVSMRSNKARQIRLEQLKSFLVLHSGLIGVHPFLKSLYAVLYLQSLSENRGGPGKRRVEWEVDVAVFIEVGGGSWMKDSVQLLKSVLGFEERSAEPVPKSYIDEDEEAVVPILHSPPSPESKRPPPPTIPPHRPAVGSLRNRALSDPFLDPRDRSPTSLGPLSPPSPTSIPSTEIYPTPSTPFLHNSSPTSSPAKPDNVESQSLQVEEIISQFRIFTVASYLTDPELKSLCNCFPTFITSKSNIIPSPPKVSLDEESAIGVSLQESSLVKVGHGKIRIGNSVREEGYLGTGWERFKIWLFSCFSRK